MEIWQKYIIIIYAIFAFTGSIKGFVESRKGRSYFKPKWGVYNLIGAFVWGDVLVFGIFWALASLASYFMNDWILFLLFISIFWLIRAWGETVYWLNQQFSSVVRVKPSDLWFYKYFKNDSVWFVYQIFWQCIMVISAVASIYLVRLFLIYD
jgi:hypothetical protein